MQCHLFCEMRLCVVLLFVSDTPRLLIGQHSCMVRVMLPPVAVALLTVHGLVLFLSFFLWLVMKKTVLLLTGSYKQKRKIPVFKKSSCTCGCSLKFTIFWKPSFFQEEDVCVFGTILISAASPDIWCRKTPFKPNTQNLMSWKCGHVKLGEHWNLAAGSSWLPAAGSIHSASNEGSMTEGSSPPFLHSDSERPV